jgi:hypothetical protein
MAGSTGRLVGTIDCDWGVGFVVPPLPLAANSTRRRLLPPPHCGARYTAVTEHSAVIERRDEDLSWADLAAPGGREALLGLISPGDFLARLREHLRRPSPKKSHDLRDLNTAEHELKVGKVCTNLRILFPECGQSVLMTEPSSKAEVTAMLDLSILSKWIGREIELSLHTAQDVSTTTTFRVRIQDEFEDQSSIVLGNLPAGLYKLAVHAVLPESQTQCDSFRYFSVFTASVEQMLSSEPFPCPLEFRESQVPTAHGKLHSTTEERWRDKQRCLERFVELYPDNMHAAFLLGKIYESRGIWDLATKSFERVMSISGISANGNGGAVRATDSTSFFNSLAEDLSLARHLATEESKTPASTCAWKVDREISLSKLSDSDSEGDLYLSVIMTFRHDDSLYCRTPRGACVDRARAALSLLLHLLVKHRLASEVILVEWNPCRFRTLRPCRHRRDGYLSAADLVRNLIPAPLGPVEVRVLEVSEEIHSKVHNPHGYDHFELHGKNAAARRARGRFVAFTNPDDLWPEALIERLARRDLREDAVYSTDIRDVIADAPVTARPEGILRLFERNIFRKQLTSAESSACTNCGARAPIQQVPQPESEAAECEDSGFAASLPGADDDTRPGRNQHPNADFTLAPRHAVLAARGHPEVPANMNTGSAAILVANGLSQLVLPRPCGIYHWQHPLSNVSRLEVLNSSELEWMVAGTRSAGPATNQPPEANTNGKPMSPRENVLWHQWNTEDWGLAGEALPETALRSHCVG